MMKPVPRISLLVVSAALSACVIMPSGPSVLALPGTGKDFNQFRSDEFECRQYANAQIGGTTPGQAAVDSGVTSAVVGTAIGALAGAAIDGSRGAAAGAGAGLVFGAAAGSGAANTSSYELQRRYDFGYIQCMYAKGHKVPVVGEFTTAPSRSAPPPAPAPPVPPPPPKPPS